jgi:DNA integrity scanning protein DisA with diadenylate cyclase activity
MIDGLLAFIHNILSPFQGNFHWVNIFEILFIIAILYIFYRKFIQNTQSENLVKGLFFLVLAWILSEILILVDLKILGVFFKSLVTLIALSLIVIFQPELRRFLGYLGQIDFFKSIIPLYSLQVNTKALNFYQLPMFSGSFSPPRI